MDNISSDRFAQEMKTFEGLCNKAQTDLQAYIAGAADIDTKNKLEKRYNEFNNLVNHVVNETNFINAPASTKYHLCIPHGTLIHSNSVAKLVIKLNNALGANIPIYKCITVGLFHDLGKHDDYKENEPTDKQKKAGYKATPPYIFNSDNPYNEHESQSLYIISKYLRLDEDEWTAILYHNSPWDGVMKCAFKRNELMTILQNSDYWSATYLEDRP